MLRFAGSKQYAHCTFGLKIPATIRQYESCFVDSTASLRLQVPDPLTIYAQKLDRRITRSSKWDRKRVPEGACFLLNRQEEDIEHGQSYWH
jgi:hypothetical protein